MRPAEGRCPNLRPNVKRMIGNLTIIDPQRRRLTNGNGSWLNLAHWWWILDRLQLITKNRLSDHGFWYCHDTDEQVKQKLNWWHQPRNLYLRPPDLGAHRACQAPEDWCQQVELSTSWNQTPEGQWLLDFIFHHPSQQPPKVTQSASEACLYHTCNSCRGWSFASRQLSSVVEPRSSARSIAGPFILATRARRLKSPRDGSV